MKRRVPSGGYWGHPTRRTVAWTGEAGVDGVGYRKLCRGSASQCSPAVGEPLGSGESLLAGGWGQMQRRASTCVPASLGGRRRPDARGYPRSCPTCAHSNWPSSRKRPRSGSIPVGEGTSLKPPSLGLHEKILGLNEEIQILPDLTLTNNNATKKNKRNI